MLNKSCGCSLQPLAFGRKSAAGHTNRSCSSNSGRAHGTCTYLQSAPTTGSKKCDPYQWILHSQLCSSITLTCYYTNQQINGSGPQRNMSTCMQSLRHLFRPRFDQPGRHSAGTASTAGTSTSKSRDRRGAEPARCFRRASDAGLGAKRPISCKALGLKTAGACASALHPAPHP